MDRLHVTYHLNVEPDDAEALARSILLEQTVETPREVAERYPFVRSAMLGERLELAPHADGGTRLRLALPVSTASVDPLQFLNVLFGNVSLHGLATLEDFELPAALAPTFHGPRFGLRGLRDRFERPEGPLTASALKPVGIPLDELERLCRDFAEGGIDLVKDDHYLADHAFCPFDARVRACQAVMDDVAAATGHRTIYAPNLSGTPDQVRRQLDVAQEAGVQAVMVAPMALGLPVLYELTQRGDVPVLAHPSFAGAGRITPLALLGKLFRLFGADAVIFPNYGGRFSYAAETCRALAEQLRAPWPPFRTVLPVPAGGMDVDRAPELVRFFGPDVMLLVGGSLLRAEDDLRDRTAAFVAAAREA